MRIGTIGMLVALSTLVACGTSDPGGQAAAATPGEAIYRAECVICHGRDGTLGMGGAKNLIRSDLNDQEMTAVITHGKGAMAGFGNILTPEQIQDVVDHVRMMQADQ